MADGTTKTDVILDVHGQQIKAAFDDIDARIAKIQSQIQLIATRAAQAGNAFGGGMQASIQQFNKMSGQLDAFERNLNKPQKERLAQLDAEETAINRRYENQRKLRKKAQQDQLAQINREEKAHNELAETKRKLRKQAKTEEDQAARRRLAQIELEERAANKLADDKRRLRKDEQKTLLKRLNDEESAANRLADEKRKLRKAEKKENERAAAEAVALINKEEEAANRVADTRRKFREQERRARQAVIAPATDRQTARAARAEERAALVNVQSLGLAKARLAETEARIAGRIEKANGLREAAWRLENRLIKADEARLGVIEKRIVALQKEHDRLVRLAQPKPGMIGPQDPFKRGTGLTPPPLAVSGDGGGGLFGSTGIAGVFARTAAYGAAASAIYGVVTAITDGVRFTLEFEDALARLSAIAGLTASQMEDLEQTIVGVGMNSRFSTTELTEAATVLAQAGFTKGEIEESLESISQLATASGVTIAEATDVVTSAVGSFNLQASETSKINDVLASALNRTKLNIQQVALGIQYAGATAKANKITFEELTAIMAVMANAGIRSGSTIGTGLRQFMVDLQAPTKKLAAELKNLGLTMEDIDIDKRGFPAVLDRLAEAGFDASKAYATLETRAAAAYLILRSNRQAIYEQIIAQTEVGQSAEAAAKGQSSLAAEWQRTKNIINAGVSESLKPATEALRDFLKVTNDVRTDTTLQELQGRVLRSSGFEKWAAKQDLETYREQKEGLIDVEERYATKLEESTTAVSEASQEIEKQQKKLSTIDETMARVVLRGDELKTNQIALEAEVATLTHRFQGLAEYLDGTALSYDGLTSALRRYRVEQLKLLDTELANKQIGSRKQELNYLGLANSSLAEARRSGLYDKLPKEVQERLQYVRKNPFDRTARSQLSEMGTKLGGNAGRFIAGYASNVTEAVSARFTTTSSGQARGVIQVAMSPYGQDLQTKVSELSGKSDGEIRGFVSDIQQQLKGTKDTAKAGFLAEIITQAQEMYGSGASPKAPENKSSGSNKEKRAGERRERSILRLRMKATEGELSNALKGLTDENGYNKMAGDGAIEVGGSNGLTKAKLLKNLERVEGALDKWIEDRTAQVMAEIESQDMGPEEAALMLEDLQREIANKRESVGREIASKLVAGLQAMLDAATEVAEDAERIADQQLAQAEGRLRALDRAGMRQRVPDYVRETYERRATEAYDAREKAQIPINEEKLAKLRKAQEEWSEVMAQANDSQDIAAMAITRKAMDDLADTISDLTYANEVLKTSFGGSELVPQTLAASWQMAVENFREANDLSQSLGDTLKMSLGDGLNALYDGLNDGLMGLVSGTHTVIGAFGNMAKAVVRYLQQMLVKMIAVQIMQQIIGMIGPSAATVSRLTPDATATIAANPAIFRYGGEVTARYGRYITDGAPYRDSVRARIAKGEYVVQKSAVDSVGVDFMDKLNERGAMALKSMGPKIVLPPPAEQKMNVFVVAPEHQPQMGPNDVLVTISQDIINGGQTKQLIRHVAQGG